MPKDLFLMHGGNYNSHPDSGDDGRYREPLTPAQAHLIRRDPELPAGANMYIDNVIGDDWTMERYRKDVIGFETGDRVYLLALPDLVHYRGMAFLTETPMIEGLTMRADLVRIKDVYEGLHDDAIDLAQIQTLGQGIMVDFCDGIGIPPCDVDAMMRIYGGEFSDYRSSTAATSVLFNPTFVPNVGEGLYLRMTVETPATNLVGSECTSCGSEYVPLPRFQMRIILDDLIFRKLKVPDHSCSNKIPVCAPYC